MEGREEPLQEENLQGQFGSDSSLVHIIGVSIARVMALWFQMQCARLFIASAEKQLLLLSLANHCLRLMFRNQLGSSLPSPTGGAK